MGFSDIDFEKLSTAVESVPDSAYLEPRTAHPYDMSKNGYAPSDMGKPDFVLLNRPDTHACIVEACRKQSFMLGLPDMYLHVERGVDAVSMVPAKIDRPATDDFLYKSVSDGASKSASAKDISFIDSGFSSFSSQDVSRDRGLGE
jgi:hypothetical protein